MATATKTRTKTTFRSKGVNFKVVIQPSFRKVTDFGHEFVPGEYADFAPHGMFETDDPRIIEKLRDSPTFNREFWEVGNEPGALPSADAELDRIMAATALLDDAELAQIEAEERAGYNRGEVIASVTRARQQVQRLVDEREAAAPAGSGD